MELRLFVQVFTQGGSRGDLGSAEDKLADFRKTEPIKPAPVGEVRPMVF